MRFCEVLKKLRKERGMTQAEAAEALGISRSTFGMYEQGNRQPDFETEEKIADLFNVSLDYLRTGEHNFHTEINSADGQPVWYLDPETARLAQEAPRAREAMQAVHRTWFTLILEEVGDRAVARTIVLLGDGLYYNAVLAGAIADDDVAGTGPQDRAELLEVVAQLKQQARSR